MRATLNTCTFARMFLPIAHAEGLLSQGELEELLKLFRRTAHALQRCAGKHPFPSWELAVQAASRERGRNRDAHPYHCPVCHEIHVGSRSKRMATLDRRFRRRQRVQRELSALEYAEVD